MSELASRATPLEPGDPAPLFTCDSSSNPEYHFDAAGGRYVVLSFFGSSTEPAAAALLEAVDRYRAWFDDHNAVFFGVSRDPADGDGKRLVTRLPGIRFFFDRDGAVSGAFGALDPAGRPRPHTVVLDPRLRCVTTFPPPADPNRLMLDVAGALLDEARHAQLGPAPILTIPRVFEPELCRVLIAYHGETGGRPTGSMRDVNGRTVEVLDRDRKRRRDRVIEDQRLRQACLWRIRQRVIPEIAKAFQFEATRIERYMVACYDGEDRGLFMQHRDNTTQATAHRRFAVSVNLNTGQYQGGELVFAEFGQQRYTVPAGGAVVFSCSLIHEATPVTDGRRYVFVPFLYDDAAASARRENKRMVGALTPTT